ncbi:hypothetical protein ebA2686 [Aromatoleum aromaticum EbN1]|uniref:Uncharacterized protein n=1 Tax=Aromatoleum aromaticum (strain DSM 19018 / LMG 30748 / EbN1) TaxID=76114 RepID=Q5P4X7_AROAE|nr:hypothetical protein ebA2686 [Aromatoleum aromaticum EbN1]
MALVTGARFRSLGAGVFHYATSPDASASTFAASHSRRPPGSLAGRMPWKWPLRHSSRRRV